MYGARLFDAAFATIAVLAWSAVGSHAVAQPTPPEYDERYRQSLSRRRQCGQVIDVEFRSQDRSNKGSVLHGLKDVLGIVIDVLRALR